ncbi:transcriptional regulator [Microbacterium sorbitolivorans]|uniref:LacI family transcriptional regulator n=1 Tax=Microbacterium sorbitolivorans TaxID=1867410 RepID=A0A367XTR1_9MICO|nr:LacI family DNA-binding transcriptional regulator [Microbacterium sorbitolivorans]RCK56998.1 LacI family transcriptional regulator [Microbacterium sorbitolivorans]GGF47534.1 transcriptional regulator [Microbacterium sorbitolivorans]
MSTPAGRAPTIIEVAARAGVSKSLASRALRGERGVADETRRRIHVAAAELGYRINSAARSLARGQSGIVGIVLNDIGNPHFTGVVAGAEAEARERGLRTIIGHGAGSAPDLARQIETMLELRVDGIVVVSSWAPREVLEHAAQLTPVAVVARLDEPPESLDMIASDDAHGARAATEHLLAIGCRHIAYVTRSTSVTSAARGRGVRTAIEQVGLELAEYRVGPEDDEEIERILRSGVDGVLANNDLTATEILRVARERGIDVPGDIALVGYDDTPLARIVSPALTSVNQPQRAMGRRAIECISERRDGRTDPERAWYEPTLLVRGSTFRR